MEKKLFDTDRSENKPPLMRMKERRKLLKRNAKKRHERWRTTTKLRRNGDVFRLCVKREKRESSVLATVPNCVKDIERSHTGPPKKRGEGGGKEQTVASGTASLLFHHRRKGADPHWGKEEILTTPAAKSRLVWTEWGKRKGGVFRESSGKRGKKKEKKAKRYSAGGSAEKKKEKEEKKAITDQKAGEGGKKGKKYHPMVKKPAKRVR